MDCKNPKPIDYVLDQCESIIKDLIKKGLIALVTTSKSPTQAFKDAVTRTGSLKTAKRVRDLAKIKRDHKKFFEQTLEKHQQPKTCHVM